MMRASLGVDRPVAIPVWRYKKSAEKNVKQKHVVRQEEADPDLQEARAALGLPKLGLSDLACAKAFFVLWGLVAHIEPRSPSGAQVDSMRALAGLLWELRTRPMMAVCPDCLCVPPTHAIWCTVGRRANLARGAFLEGLPRACGNYWDAPPRGTRHPGTLEAWREPRRGPCVLSRGHRGPCCDSLPSALDSLEARVAVPPTDLDELDSDEGDA